ncbi:hypothetical protein TcasGA2_TC032240 [Tribolium castaneum]|uniref:Uncharacterized protein n=1 Tax=Tribolium castaneum TaxID=7070 RepID=A0A139WN25_TRICA|nr:hypothetical protein TcasGA2_TC032240 [Tribolium castaneum]
MNHLTKTPDVRLEAYFSGSSSASSLLSACPMAPPGAHQRGRPSGATVPSKQGTSTHHPGLRLPYRYLGYPDNDVKYLGDETAPKTFGWHQRRGITKYERKTDRFLRSD